MARELTQRELRNESGDIMRQLDRGESFVVTRNGVPVAEAVTHVVEVVRSRTNVGPSAS